MGDVLSGALGVRWQQSIRQALVVRSAVAGRTGWARKRAAPLRAFLQTESGSAGILLGAIVVALIWANIDIAGYERVWHGGFSIRLSDVQVTRDLRTWISSGLPTLYFLVER